MKFSLTAITTLSLVIFAESALKDLRADIFNIYNKAAIEIKNITDKQVKPEQVTYYLYTRQNRENFVQINSRNVNKLKNQDCTVAFIIHGWTGSRKNDWYEDFKNAFLNKKEKFCVVQVDWEEPADELYSISAQNTNDVGTFVAEFLTDIHKKAGVPLDKFLIVGHSLGGQVAGFVGKKIREQTGQKLPRIIALDPAGPLYNDRAEKERLGKNDAKIVEVIHTDAGTFGFKTSLGTIDFYPNGGSSQPGCARIDLADISSVTDPVWCDHQRAPKYFVEAILNPGEFVAVKCSSWEKYKEDKCEKEQVNMGDLGVMATGDFYLETNKEKPFAKKRSGSRGISKLVQNF